MSNIDSLGPVWASFLSFGPTFWAEHNSPPIPSGLILPKVNGLLVETPFVEYLDWRRNLDPSRFDYYHPIVGPELSQLPGAQNITPPPSGGTPGSSTGGGGSPTPPSTHIPEPGTLLIALSLVGAASFWGCHARISVAKTVNQG